VSQLLLLLLQHQLPDLLLQFMDCLLQVALLLLLLLLVLTLPVRCVNLFPSLFLLLCLYLVHLLPELLQLLLGGPLLLISGLLLLLQAPQLLQFCPELVQLLVMSQLLLLLCRRQWQQRQRSLFECFLHVRPLVLRCLT